MPVARSLSRSTSVEEATGGIMQDIRYGKRRALRRWGTELIATLVMVSIILVLYLKLSVGSDRARRSVRDVAQQGEVAIGQALDRAADAKVGTLFVGAKQSIVRGMKVQAGMMDNAPMEKQEDKGFLKQLHDLKHAAHPVDEEQDLEEEEEEEGADDDDFLKKHRNHPADEEEEEEEEAGGFHNMHRHPPLIEDDIEEDNVDGNEGGKSLDAVVERMKQYQDRAEDGVDGEDEDYDQEDEDNLESNGEDAENLEGDGYGGGDDEKAQKNFNKIKDIAKLQDANNENSVDKKLVFKPVEEIAKPPNLI